MFSIVWSQFYEHGPVCTGGGLLHQESRYTFTLNNTVFIRTDYIYLFRGAGDEINIFLF